MQIGETRLLPRAKARRREDKAGREMTIDLPQVGRDKFKGVDIRIRVRGGGNMSQAYAVRQAIAKGIVAYYREYLPPILMAPAA